MQNFLLQFVSIFDRNDCVLLAPDDERWLVDEMGVLLDAVRVPGTRCREQAVMAVGGKEWAADRFDAFVVDEMLIGFCDRAPHAVPHQVCRVRDKRCYHFTYSANR